MRIEVTEVAKLDMAVYRAADRKIILAGIREQLTHQPEAETKNRKRLRDNPVATWELRLGRFRVFYEVDAAADLVSVVSVGHKEHNAVWIRGQEVSL